MLFLTLSFFILMSIFLRNFICMTLNLNVCFSLMFVHYYFTNIVLTFSIILFALFLVFHFFLSRYLHTIKDLSCCSYSLSIFPSCSTNMYIQLSAYSFCLSLTCTLYFLVFYVFYFVNVYFIYIVLQFFANISLTSVNIT